MHEAMPMPAQEPKKIPPSGWSPIEEAASTTRMPAGFIPHDEELPVSAEPAINIDTTMYTSETPVGEGEPIRQHGIELVPGYNDPDYRGISDKARHVEPFEEQPVTLRSHQLVKEEDAEHTSGVRSKSPEEAHIEEQQKRKAG